MASARTHYLQRCLRRTGSDVTYMTCDCPLLAAALDVSRLTRTVRRRHVTAADPLATGIFRRGLQITAVRYAADDDSPAGCGHPEPAVLARRHWSGSECCVASESALDRLRLVWILLRRVRGEDNHASAGIPAAGNPISVTGQVSAGLASGQGPAARPIRWNRPGEERPLELIRAGRSV